MFGHNSGARTARRTRALIAAAVGSVLFAGGSRAGAATIPWVNAAGGNFSSGLNWTGGVAPVAVDTAQFNSANTYNVTFDGNIANSGLGVGGSNATFVTNGTARTYNVTSGATISGGSLTLGASAAALLLNVTGNLDLQSGKNLTVVAGNDVAINGTLLIATNTVGNSSASFSDAGTTLSGQVVMGQNAGSASLIFSNSASGNLASISATASGINGSNSTIVCQSGASVTSTAMTLGNGTLNTQFTNMTVTGAGSTWTQSGASTIALGAASGSSTTLNVTASGVLNTGTGGMTINPTAIVNVNAGTLNANGNITITGGLLNNASGFTWANNKTMNIASGGRFDDVPSFTSPSGSVITVSGVNSRLKVASGTSVGSTYASGSATTSLAVSAAGLLQADFLVLGLNGGSGTVTVDGTGSALNANGTTGGFINAVGFGAGSASLTFSTNASGSFTNVLQVADTVTGSATGVVNVLSGADLTTGDIAISTASGAGAAGGVMTVDGPGSTITQSASAALTIGGNAGTGPGTLNIQTSGTFTTGGATTTLTVRPSGTLNLNGGALIANGNISVPGGLVTANGFFTWASGKTLSISSGGRFDHTGSITTTGAIVNVTGANSRLRVTAGDLLASGGSIFNITAGGSLQPDFLFVGDGGPGANAVTVDGSGSTLTVGGTTVNFISAIGRSGGSGSLTLSTNAVGTFVNPLRIADTGGAGTSGTLNVQTASTLTTGNIAIATATGSGATGAATVTGPGSSIVQTGASTLAVGGSVGTGTGALNVLSSGTFTSGTGAITVNPTGTINVNGGSLLANGNISITGGLISKAVGVFSWAGSKTMNISAGGRFDHTGTFSLPVSSTVNIAGSGSRLKVAGGDLVVNGGSTITVATSGLLQPDFLFLGNFATSGNAVTVDGPGSTLTVGGTTATFVSAIGREGGSGSVTLSNNAIGSFTNLLNVADTGGAGTAGLLTVQTGADLTLGSLAITTTTSFNGVTGTVIVTGPGSTIVQSSAATLAVGGPAGTGIGTLFSNSAATFTTGTGAISVGPTGKIIIDDGNFNANGNMTINAGVMTEFDTAHFSIAAGKTLTATNIAQVTFHQDFSLGGGSAFVFQSGADFTTTGFFDIGNGPANGTLTVDGAGTAFTTNATSFWGGGGSAANVQFSNNADGTIAGANMCASAGTSNLSVLSGATIDFSGGGLQVQATTSSSAAATVTIASNTANTSILTTNGLFIGNTSGGTGIVNVNTGGLLQPNPANSFVIRATGTLNVGGGKINAGDLGIAAGGHFNINSGTVALNTIANNGNIVQTFGSAHMDLIGGTGALQVGGGTLSAAAIQQTALTVNGTGRVSVDQNGTNSGTSKVNTLAITGNGHLDLINNKLIATGVSVGVFSGGQYNGVSGMIARGRNAGTWDGPGVDTSMPEAAAGFTALGVATATQANLAGGTFGGISVTGPETLVMYTYAGDATLDGKINVDDYGRIDFNVTLPGASGWSNGDFNYDGKINVDDYGIIDSNVPIQGAPFPTSSSPLAGVADQPALSAVPEPASLLSATAMLLTLPATRGRRRSNDVPRNVPRGTFP